MSTTSDLIPDNHRLLKVYIYYRLAMSVLLNVLFLSGLAGNILGTDRPEIFLYTSFIYIGFCCFSLTSYLTGIIKTDTNHVVFLLIVDVIALVLIIYTSIRASVGLGYLLLIPMAIGGTFLKGQTNIALAAFVSLLLITASVINSLDGSQHGFPLFTAGITGVLLFVTAIAFRLLSKKIQTSEHLVQEQIEHANYLHNMGQRIVETIHTGIVVIDNNLNIQLINQAAKKLLSHKQPFHSITQINDIYHILIHWKTTHIIPKTHTLNLGVNHDLKISFANLSDVQLTSIMLFIEDERHIHQEAQQLKLASLGRLTASIAHEIRNPLSAISHASQLLDESESISQKDQELLNMIQINSQRINQIISDILEFSRRKVASLKTVNIRQWLDKFCHDYLAHNKAHIHLSHLQKTIYCQVDPNHLHQIINNLVENALFHGQKSDLEQQVTITTNIDSRTQLPYIDIIDPGEGISDEHIDKIFEPFYTTKPTGSGLGLYLCKELCHANQADIVYFKKDKQRNNCFRLLLQT
ncbi:hypothetical protein AB835_00995 [Candidatus Endobugula sertula]|uniref:histidine kinase n=1 Tax=Candidatus Endobugula sertula TaxID=62101 RepID=A0A1D2QTF2_9GAMM|nr:hypothetical protein AB835_00995 [Candidatus Endobugula sertula]